MTIGALLDLSGPLRAIPYPVNCSICDHAEEMSWGSRWKQEEGSPELWELAVTSAGSCLPCAQRFGVLAGCVRRVTLDVSAGVQLCLWVHTLSTEMPRIQCSTGSSLDLSHLAAPLRIRREHLVHSSRT